jgi:hypothetical protein
MSVRSRTQSHLNLLNVNIFMHKTTKPAVRHLAADALLEISAAFISAVLSRDEHLSHTDTFFVLKVYCQSYSFIRDLFLRKINSSEQQQTISMRSNVRDLTYFHMLGFLGNITPASCCATIGWCVIVLFPR